jgi:hypothetical protein
MKWYDVNKIELVEGTEYRVLLKSMYKCKALYINGKFKLRGEILNVIGIFK